MPQMAPSMWHMIMIMTFCMLLVVVPVNFFFIKLSAVFLPVKNKNLGNSWKW